MRIFQNKFFLICLCIALVLTIVPSVFAVMGYRGLAKNIVGTVTMPVRWVATVVGDAFEGWEKYFVPRLGVYLLNISYVPCPV